MRCKVKQQSRSNGLQTLGQAVSRVIQEATTRRGFHEIALLTHWPTIAGRETAAVCLPHKLTFHYRKRHDNGTLLILVEGGSAAIRLQHTSTQLITKINTYFGYSLVDQIRIIQGPFPRGKYILTFHKRNYNPQPEPLLQGNGYSISPSIVLSIKDNNLREALLGLGLSIFCRQKR